MSVSRRVMHRRLYSIILEPLIGIPFSVFYIFFVKEPLVLWIIVHLIFLLLSITTGAIPTLLTDAIVACLPRETGPWKHYRCLTGGIGGVVVTGVYCTAIAHIRGMASSELSENILSGGSLVVCIIPVLPAGVVMGRIIIHLPGLDISYPGTDSLS